MTLVDPRPLVAHAYQPLNGWPRAPYGAWLRTWAEAQFLDANRWRDVVYVLILLPLGILEFVVAIGLWLLGLRAARGAADRPDHPLGRVAATGGPRPGVRARRPPVRVPHRPRAGADRGRRLARPDDPAPGGRPGAAVRRPDGGPAPGRGAPPRQPVGGARGSRRRSCGGSSATSTTAPSSASCRSRSTSGGPRSGSTRTPPPRRRSSRTRGRRPGSRSRSCGTSSAARCRRSSSTAGSRRRWRRSPPAAPCRRPSISTLGPGERLPPVVERAAYFVVVEALANVAKHSRATRVRGRRPPRPLGARRGGARRRGAAARDRRRAAGWPGWATARRRSTGRSR